MSIQQELEDGQLARFEVKPGIPNIFVLNLDIKYTDIYAVFTLITPYAYLVYHVWVAPYMLYYDSSTMTAPC